MAKFDKSVLAKYGITGTTEVLYNPSYEVLFNEETKEGLEGFEVGQETELGADGVLSATTSPGFGSGGAPASATLANTTCEGDDDGEFVFLPNAIAFIRYFFFFNDVKKSETNPDFSSFGASIF